MYLCVYNIHRFLLVWRTKTFCSVISVEYNNFAEHFSLPFSYIILIALVKMNLWINSTPYILLRLSWALFSIFKFKLSTILPKHAYLQWKKSGLHLNLLERTKFITVLCNKTTLQLSDSLKNWQTFCIWHKCLDTSRCRVPIKRILQ